MSSPTRQAEKTTVEAVVVPPCRAARREVTTQTYSWHETLSNLQAIEPSKPDLTGVKLTSGSNCGSRKALHRKPASVIITNSDASLLA